MPNKTNFFKCDFHFFVLFNSKIFFHNLKILQLSKEEKKKKRKEETKTTKENRKEDHGKRRQQ